MSEPCTSCKFPHTVVHEGPNHYCRICSRNERLRHLSYQSRDVEATILLANILIELKADAPVEINAALEIIESDPHQWSHRPCPTCDTVSRITRRPFGCMKIQR